MNDYPEISFRLLTALGFGGLVGLERSYHGRPAGFRTHTLVCLASAALMLVTVYEGQWFVSQGMERVSIDPTRMAQGIMTGIGFLGAGVIMKEGLSVRGLTTAASIWITAAIGIVIGAGFYAAAAVATLLTLATLSVFRWLERIFPSLVFARLTVRSTRATQLTEDALTHLIHEQGIASIQTAYRLAENGTCVEYEMTIQSRDMKNFRDLAERLAALPQVLDYSLSTTGEK